MPHKNFLSHVPPAKCALTPHVSRALRALVPHRSHALRDLVPCEKVRSDWGNKNAEFCQLVSVTKLSSGEHTSFVIIHH